MCIHLWQFSDTRYVKSVYIYTYLRRVSVIVRIPLYFLQEGKTADEMEVLVGMYNVFYTY